MDTASYFTALLTRGDLICSLSLEQSQEFCSVGPSAPASAAALQNAGHYQSSEFKESLPGFCSRAKLMALTCFSNAPEGCLKVAIEFHEEPGASTMFSWDDSSEGCDQIWMMCDLH